MKFIDFFAGIGGFRKGLELAGHECVGFCEWDKYATMSYTAIHLLNDEQREKLAGMTLKERQKEILKDEYRNGEWYSNDIRDVDAGNMPRADLWCAGFPCQDISIAGKQLGFDGNRSSLYFQIIRLLRETAEENRPKYLLLENVKNLLSVNHGWDFARVLFALDETGYDAQWKVLNTKDYGIPQNRERVFVVAIKRGVAEQIEFPEPVPLDKKLVDVLEEYVDEKYYLSQETIDALNIHKARNRQKGNGFGWQPTDGSGIAHAIKTEAGYRPDTNYVIQTCQLYGTENEPNPQAGRVYDADGLSPCLDSCGGGQQDAYNFREIMKYKTTSGNDVSGTLRASMHKNGARNIVENIQSGRGYEGIVEESGNNVRIRKLTPKECFRLQGWKDEDFEKAEMVNSNSQLYKQAGNGVTVDVIKAIGERLKD